MGQEIPNSNDQTCTNEHFFVCTGEPPGVEYQSFPYQIGNDFHRMLPLSGCPVNTLRFVVNRVKCPQCPGVEGPVPDIDPNIVDKEDEQQFGPPENRRNWMGWKVTP